MNETESVRLAKLAFEKAQETQQASTTEVRAARIDRSRARRKVAALRRELQAAVAQLRAIDPTAKIPPEIEAALASSESRVAELEMLTRRRTRAPKPFPPPPRIAGSVVYFVQARDGGPIKIGTTKDLEQRMRHMQAGSPVELVVIAATVGDSALESALHRRLAKHRLHGEWFADVEAVRAAMKAVLQ